MAALAARNARMSDDLVARIERELLAVERDDDAQRGRCRSRQAHAARPRSSTWCRRGLCRKPSWRVRTGAGGEDRPRARAPACACGAELAEQIEWQRMRAFGIPASKASAAPAIIMACGKVPELRRKRSNSVARPQTLCHESPHVFATRSDPAMQMRSTCLGISRSAGLKGSMPEPNRNVLHGPWRAVLVLGDDADFHLGRAVLPACSDRAADRGRTRLVAELRHGRVFARPAGCRAWCRRRIGRPIDRHGGHRVMPVGSLLAALGLVAADGRRPSGRLSRGLDTARRGDRGVALRFRLRHARPHFWRPRAPADHRVDPGRRIRLDGELAVDPNVDRGRWLARDLSRPCQSACLRGRAFARLRPAASARRTGSAIRPPRRRHPTVWRRVAGRS